MLLVFQLLNIPIVSENPTTIVTQSNSSDGKTRKTGCRMTNAGPGVGGIVQKFITFLKKLQTENCILWMVGYKTTYPFSGLLDAHSHALKAELLNTRCICHKA